MINIQSLIFNDRLIDTIQQGEAHAAYNTSVQDEYIGDYWFIIDIWKLVKAENKLYSNQQNKSLLKYAKATVILDLIAGINEKDREIEDRRIIIGINYREIHKMIIEEIKMANQQIKEGVAEVVRIKRF